MNFVSQPQHPNGFKIALALNLTGVDLCCSKEKAVQDGAALYVPEHRCARTSMCLAPNTAVLHLFSSKANSSQIMADDNTESWVNWESAVLQRCVFCSLQSVCSTRPDQATLQLLEAALDKLEKCISSSKLQFFSGKHLGSVDVVLLGSLLPLTAGTTTAALLSRRPALQSYTDAALQQGAVQQVLKSWYGGLSISVRPWLSAGPSLSLPAPAPPSTLALLKTATPTQLSSPAAPSTTASEPACEGRRVSAAEVAAARQGWLAEDGCRRTKTSVTPVLPVPGERNVLITSALPYVNNVPHLGNIIGCLLSADCFARFCRLREDNVLYICGTDEYGTATETKAIAEGCTPREVCDKYHAIHTKVYKDFNICFDYFGRTTTDCHTEIVHELFWDLHREGHISQDSVEQLFCEACQRFLADRFVEGTCPHPGCGYEDARGDQCDGCGRLVNAIDLVAPRCKLCSASPRVQSSRHLFIDLPGIEPQLRQWFKESSVSWTHNSATICQAWLRDGLLPRCITRDLKWGVPVPLEGFTDKVFYVWFDAPLGYVSITKEYTADWQRWWKPPREQKVQLYQFMAKDNVPFHGIIFPCTLTGSKAPWTRVTHLMATEYLNYEDRKFSKSRGVGVFGDEAIGTGIPIDVWRFYLLYIRPEAHDTAFSWSDLQMKNNTELLNNLGNFVNRSLKFVSQFYDGVVPEAHPTDADYAVMAAVNFELQAYTTALSAVCLRDGLRHILAITKLGNQYIQDNEPYKLIKAGRSTEEQARGASVIAVSVNIVHLVALLLEPYMPDTSAQILAFLNMPPASDARLPAMMSCAVVAGALVIEPRPLISKISDEQLVKWRARFSGDSSSQLVQAAPEETQRLQEQVTKQGDLVRALKASGVSKEVTGAAVASLLEYKKQLEAAQGSVAQASTEGKKKKPVSGNNKKLANGPVPDDAGHTPASVASAVATPGNEAEVTRLTSLVAEQGDAVRALKSSGASKAEVTEAVAELLSLKTQLAQARGQDPPPVKPGKTMAKKK